MKNLQTAPIQVPDFQTCKLLKVAGLLPPKNDYFGRDFSFAFSLKGLFYAGFFDEDFEFSVSTGGFIEDAVFAPTSDQLLTLITEIAIEKGYDFRLYNEALQLYGDSDAWQITNKKIKGNIAANTNTAQYLAEVLLWLLKQ